MKRILLIITVAVVMGAMMAVMAAPAFAIPGKCSGACRGLGPFVNPTKEQNTQGEARNCGTQGTQQSNTGSNGGQNSSCWGDFNN
jgi:hypothetical protein